METEDFLEKRFIKTDSIVARKIGNEFIMVPIRRKPGEVESVYALNEVAAFVWELIDGDRSVEQVRDAIVAEFDVAPEQAEEDAVELLIQLSEIGALEER